MKLFGFNITRATPKRSGNYIARDFGAAGAEDLLADWQMDGGWVPGTMASQLPTMRARARQEVKNNPWARRIVDLFAVNTVGHTGFSYRPMPPFGPGKIDEVAAAILKLAWWRWAHNPKVCDIAGRFDFRSHCETAARALCRDGEAFIRIIRGKIPGNQHGIALQQLNPAMLDANLNITKHGGMAGMVGSAIVNGVEIDQWGKPLAYWFADRSQDAIMWTADYLRAYGQYQRIPAEQICHCYQPDLPDQTRGVPMMYSVLRRLHMLGKYEDAELTAARKDASVSNSYQLAPGMQPDDLADVADVAGAVSQVSEGDSLILPEGWQEVSHTPTRPNQAMPDFVKHLLRGTGAGTNTAYSTLANDQSEANYSSLRDGKLTERDCYMMAQEMIIRDICRPVNLAWLEQYLLRPDTPLPFSKLDKFSEHEWQGRRWPWVDPNSESRYNETARNYGWKTDETIAAEIGEDMADNLATIKATIPAVKGTYLEGKYAAEQPTERSR